MSVVVYDPKKFLSFTCCTNCSTKPCDILRFGGVLPGKSLVVYQRDFSPYTTGCPFMCTDSWEMQEILEQASQHQIRNFVDDALMNLSTVERNSNDFNHWITTPDDHTGFISYLIRLCEESIISLLRIPFFYESDHAMSAWLHAYEMPVRLKHTYATTKTTSSEPAVTDTMGAPGSSAQAGGGQPSISEQEPESTKPINALFRLKIDPSAPESQDDTFTLYSTDAMKSYRQVKTVKDDKTPGDNCTDIEFTGIYPNLKYSLEINKGKEAEPYFDFENKPGKDFMP